jgi:hypothetical protein
MELVQWRESEAPSSDQHQEALPLEPPAMARVVPLRRR